MGILSEPGPLRRLFERILMATRISSNVYLDNARAVHAAQGNQAAVEGGKKQSAFSNFYSQIERSEYTFAFFLKAISYLNLKNVKLSLSFEFNNVEYTVGTEISIDGNKTQLGEKDGT